MAFGDLLLTKEWRWVNPAGPVGSLWDEFCNQNPDARSWLHELQGAERYELSERQCSAAVAYALATRGLGNWQPT